MPNPPKEWFDLREKGAVDYEKNEHFPDAEKLRNDTHDIAKKYAEGDEEAIAQVEEELGE